MKKFFLPLVGVWAFIGCSQDAIEPNGATYADSKSTTIALSIEATADVSEMRAVSFNTNENVPPTIHEEGISDWTTHCFLRKDDGSKRAYAVIHWDASLEGGKVKLKMRGHELKLLPIGSTSTELSPENKPVVGERWLIKGITGGGKLNEDRTRLEFTSTGAYDGLEAHQAQVPFSFELQGFPITANVGEPAPQLEVKFKPQGSLLNIYINNKKNQLQYGVATDLQVTTNALSCDGFYDYDDTNDVEWIFTNEEADEEVLSRPVSIAANTAKHYLLWGMPRPEEDEPSEGFKSSIKLNRCRIYAEGQTTEPASREGAFKQGLAYWRGIDVAQSWSPLNAILTTGEPNYVVKFINSRDKKFIDPTSLTKAQDIYNSGIYYTYADAVKYFGLNSGSNTSAYYLPTIWELGTIFPSERLYSQNSPVYYFNRTNAFGDPIKEKVQFSKDAAPVEVTSMYTGTDGTRKILYALRFSDYDGNSKRTAFRYQCYLLKTLEGGREIEALKVTTRYLGNHGDGTNYATEDYWTDPSKNAQDVTVTIPSLGYTKPNTGSKSGLGSYASYWSSTPNGNKSRAVHFLNTYVEGYSSDTSTEAFPLILFPKN